MRNVIMKKLSRVLFTSLLIPLPAQARCEEVIQKCDVVIQRQSDLILTMQEKTDLLERKVSYLDEELTSTKRTNAYLLIGAFAAGVLLRGLASK